MNGYLLDTNVVSMLAPLKSEASAAFLEWLERVDGEGKLFLSVVTVHEIEKGIALLDHKGASTKAAALKAWLTGLLAAYGDRLLALDAASASLSGRLEAKAIAGGQNPGAADAIVAGVAQAHDLAVVTRNVKDFIPFGVAVMTPEEASQGS